MELLWWGYFGEQHRNIDGDIIDDNNGDDVCFMVKTIILAEDKYFNKDGRGEHVTINCKFYLTYISLISD